MPSPLEVATLPARPGGAMDVKDLPRLIPHPSELFKADAAPAEACPAQGGESPEAVAFAKNFPPFPTTLGTLEGTRTIYKWAQIMMAFHGVMAGTFVQGRLLEAANAMNAEQYLGWQAIGVALWEMVRGPTDDDVMH